MNSIRNEVTTAGGRLKALPYADGMEGQPEAA